MNQKDFEIFGATGYTTMCNYHFQDKNLTLKAKGLLGLMLSLPKNWDYSINGLATLSKDGRDSIRSCLDELKQAEYLIIDKFKAEKGRFRYKYRIYYLPYPKWLKMQDLTTYGNSTLEDSSPDTDFPGMEVPDMENPTQQNNNKKNKEIIKDKIDKHQGLIKGEEEIKHNILTYELIYKNYISENDCSSFLYDDFFESLLKEGYTYKNLVVMVNYVISRVIERNFIDEEGNEIKNKFGYFKNAINSNINKLNNPIDSEDLFNPEEYDWLNDEEEDFEL